MRFTIDPSQLPPPRQPLDVAQHLGFESIPQGYRVELQRPNPKEGDAAWLEWTPLRLQQGLAGLDEVRVAELRACLNYIALAENPFDDSELEYLGPLSVGMERMPRDYSSYAAHFLVERVDEAKLSAEGSASERFREKGAFEQREFRLEKIILKNAGIDRHALWNAKDDAELTNACTTLDSYARTLQRQVEICYGAALGYLRRLRDIVRATTTEYYLRFGSDHGTEFEARTVEMWHRLRRGLPYEHLRPLIDSHFKPFQDSPDPRDRAFAEAQGGGMKYHLRTYDRYCGFYYWIDWERRKCEELLTALMMRSAMRSVTASVVVPVERPWSHLPTQVERRQAMAAVVLIDPEGGTRFDPEAGTFKVMEGHHFPDLDDVWRERTYTELYEWISYVIAWDSKQKGSLEDGPIDPGAIRKQLKRWITWTEVTEMEDFGEVAQIWYTEHGLSFTAEERRALLKEVADYNGVDPILPD